MMLEFKCQSKLCCQARGIELKSSVSQPPMLSAIPGYSYPRAHIFCPLLYILKPERGAWTIITTRASGEMFGN